jgi:hypothetical protein
VAGGVLVTRKVLIGIALLLVFAGMGVVGFHTRSQGLDRLREVLAEQESAGYGDSFDDLVAMAPPVDEDRQRRVWDWMEARAKLQSSYSRPLDEACYFTDAEQPPEEDRNWSEELRPAMEDLRGILREGPVCLTSLGWARHDAERLASSRVSERQLRLPHLLRLREAHRWFALEAMTAEDPGASLDDLDRLASSLQSPGCLIDAMVVGACASMRDRAFVRLAVHGDLPKERLDRWLAEPPLGISWMADAWRGERLLYWAPLGQDLLAGSSMGDHFDDQGGGVEGWLHGASKCALFLEFLGANEGHLRGDVDADTLLRAKASVKDLGLPYELARGNRAATCMVAVVLNADHRLARAGAAVALASQQHARVPNTEAEARHWMGDHEPLLEAGPWNVALRYERLGERRFRLAVDPDSAVPSVLVGTNEAAQLTRSPFGEPASKQILYVGRGGFEFQIP